MRAFFGLVLFMPCFSYSMNAQYEAFWQWQTELEQPNAAHPSLSNPSKKTSAGFELSAQKKGFAVATEINADALKLKELYYDTQGWGAEWTLGIKPQTWAYAYQATTLNLLGDGPQLSAEWYIGANTLQLGCAEQTNETSACFARLSGWINGFDWQVLMNNGTKHNLALGLQSQIGQGGLVYGETSATINFENPYHTVGLQWTSPWQQTLRLEASANHETTQQWFVQAEQGWQDFTATTQLITPSTDTTNWIWNNSIEWQVDARLTLALNWQHFNNEGAIASSGQGDKINVKLSFKDGF